jgi:hypothetical protein
MEFSCSCKVYVRYIQATTVTSANNYYPITFKRSILGYADANYVLGTSTSKGSGVYVVDCQFVRVKNTYLSNIKYGIQSANSRIWSYDNDDTGTQPIYGLFATQGGIIGKRGTQPTGSTGDEQWLYGGKIRGEPTRFGTPGNYTEFAADGEITQVGTARTIKYTWLSTSAVSAPTAGAATETVNGNGFAVYAFPDNLERYIRANIKIPSDIDLTADSYICLTWSSPTTSQNCDWEVTHLITAPGDSTDQAGAMNQSYEASSATADGLVMSQITTISGGTIQSDESTLHVIVMRDGNDASDNLGDIAELHGIAFKYTSNRLGETI